MKVKVSKLLDLKKQEINILEEIFFINKMREVIRRSERPPELKNNLTQQIESLYNKH